VDMGAVRADLEMVAKARILFVHQSVGRNILEGVQALAAEAGVPVRVQAIDALPPDKGPGIFHRDIGSNGDPQSKLDAFSALLERPERPAYDAALLKFCYLDLDRDAKGSDGLLDRYLARTRDLQAARPDVRLVHASAPLRADPPGWKTRVKRWLGRETWEDADNLRRNAFNEGLRSRLGATPYFDIAGIESTLPDGTRSAFTAGGRTVYTLAQAYTSDGGHLNPQGSRRVAAAFVHVLADALRRPQPRSETP